MDFKERFIIGTKLYFEPAKDWRVWLVTVLGTIPLFYYDVIAK